MRKVYKWVRRGHRKRFSPLMTREDRDFLLSYSTELWTTAPKKYPQAWPFAYSTLRMAIQDAWDAPDMELWACEATRTRRSLYLFSPYYESMSYNYRNLDDDGLSYLDDIVQCEAIRLVRQLR